MADTGKDLGLDLYRLYTMANTNLPDVATEYDTATNDIGAVDPALAQAFVRPAQFGGTNGSAYTPWTTMRDTVQEILRDTSTNLADTAQALNWAVDAYCARDHAAATEFRRLQQQNAPR